MCLPLESCSSYLSLKVKSSTLGHAFLPERIGRSRPTGSTCGTAALQGPRSCRRPGEPRQTRSSSRRHLGSCRWSGSSRRCSAPPRGCLWNECNRWGCPRTEIKALSCKRPFLSSHLNTSIEFIKPDAIYSMPIGHLYILGPKY